MHVARGLRQTLIQNLPSTTSISISYHMTGAITSIISKMVNRYQSVYSYGNVWHLSRFILGLSSVPEIIWSKSCWCTLIPDTLLFRFLLQVGGGWSYDISYARSHVRRTLFSLISHTARIQFFGRLIGYDIYTILGGDYICYRNTVKPLRLPTILHTNSKNI